LKGHDENIDILHYPVLTKKEKLLVEYFLRGNSIHTVSEEITSSENILYNYRFNIHEKIGFPHVGMDGIFLQKKPCSDYQ